jgi:hypothetical protein
LAWRIGVFAGVFEEIGVSAWCFCGQNVVDCVAIVETGRTLFEALIFCRDPKYFFGQANGGSNGKALSNREGLSCFTNEAA